MSDVLQNILIVLVTVLIAAVLVGCATVVKTPSGKAITLCDDGVAVINQCPELK